VTPRRLRLGAAGVIGALLVALGGSAPAAPRRVTITGRGWGHGIGMSQYGAYGRALNGQRAGAILRHYYKGARVRKARVADRVRVGLLQGQRSISATSLPRVDGGAGAVTWKVYGAARHLAQGPSGTKWRVEPSPTGGMRLYRNGVKVKRRGHTVFGSPRRPLVLVGNGPALVRIVDKGLNYAHGKVYFASYAPASCGLPFCLRLVLRLPMQKYVYGLGEVPSSWPQASLRAQAIAARTYAHRRIINDGQHRDPCDCALYDSAIDQVYAGDAKRTGSGPYWPDWKEAVDATARRVIMYRGQPVQALYSSSSGGHTENNENVWGGTPVPYLRGVVDRADAVEANPNHRWRLVMTWPTFARRLDVAFGVGKLKSFRLVKPLGVSGRVTVVKSATRGGVRIAGARRIARADGWAIRDALDLRDTWFRVRVTFGVAAELQEMYQHLDGAPGEALGRAYSVPLDEGPTLGRAQRFERGRMTWVSMHDRSVWQQGPVLDRYDAMGRERSILGMPKTSVRTGRGYSSAAYEGGLIVWSRRTGAHAVVGAFARRYLSAGGPEGPLGLPLGEAGTSASALRSGARPSALRSGRARPSALRSGRARPVQRFENGALYSDDSGAGVLALWGPVYEQYRRRGGLLSACGAPDSGVVAAGERVTASFEHGSIGWSPAGGAVVDCGA
jgi:SpoIID/LytB domain protein